MRDMNVNSADFSSSSKGEELLKEKLLKPAQGYPEHTPMGLSQVFNYSLRG
jgi:hypothetical protein